MVNEKDKLTLVRFGEQLKRLRKEQKFSYREFSKRSGVNTGDIINYEKGLTAPTLLTIKKLAIGLGMHPAELLNIDFGIDFSAGIE